MNKQTIITALLVLVAMAFASCDSDEPHWADPEAHEKTEQLRTQYGPLMVGTWHYEKVGASQRFFEQLTFFAEQSGKAERKDDGTFTGMRKWQTRKLVTIDGENQNYMAYSTCLTFGYADETTLHIQGFYVHDDDGWADYQRGEIEPSF